MRKKRSSGQWPIWSHHLAITMMAASFIALEVGCSTPRQAKNGGFDSIVVQARLVDVLGYPVSVSAQYADAALGLGAIAGAVTGSPGRTLQYAAFTDMPTIEINASALKAALIEQTAAETKKSMDSGLRIEPADTRFARISTLLMNKGMAVGGIFAGFIDADSKNAMTLFYFDRPCRLTGFARGDANSLSRTYDVVVAKPGLNWLIAQPREAGGLTVRIADESIHEMFVAAPSANRKIGLFQIR